MSKRLTLSRIKKERDHEHVPVDPKDAGDQKEVRPKLPYLHEDVDAPSAQKKEQEN
jgi:hypothetical protein